MSKVFSHENLESFLETVQNQELIDQIVLSKESILRKIIEDSKYAEFSDMERISTFKVSDIYFPSNILDFH